MLTFRSPAKLNLFFRVLYKRPDSFHEIASIYQAIDLFDVVTIHLSEKDQFLCNEQSLVFSENLVLKALELFREKTNITQKVSIFLKKNIPIGAGLGGGSSNAATTLWGLNQIFKLGLSKKELMDLSKPLGSDVPFFFSSGSSLCLGKGEIVHPLKLPKYVGWVIHPKFHMSTPCVYKKVSLDKVSNIPVSELVSSFKNHRPIFMNDLEHAAFNVEPELKKIKLRFPSATLSGSGSCFFSLVKPEKTKEHAFSFKSVHSSKDTWF